MKGGCALGADQITESFLFFIFFINEYINELIEKRSLHFQHARKEGTEEKLL